MRNHVLDEADIHRDGSKETLPGNEKFAGAPRADTFKMLELFGDVLSTVESQYVTPVDDKKLITSAITGMVAGLDQPTLGEVNVVGRPALMFQEAALFPWLDVVDNVALPLRLLGVPRQETLLRTAEMVERLATECSVRVVTTAVWKFLDRRDQTYKKRLPMPVSRSVPT